MRRAKIFPILLAVILCFAIMPVSAFTGGGLEDYEGVLEYWSQAFTPPQTEQQTPQQTVQQSPEQGEALSTGSEFSTRDLLYDKATNKQFITVEGRDGNTFYIVIDYDAPVNEDGEQYQTYFLNKVDEADLAALVEQGEPAACSCTEKCHAGAVNTSCSLCAVNMTECVGKELEPEKPLESAEPDPEAKPEPEPVKKSGAIGPLPVILAVAVLGGAATYFLKFKKKKPDTRGSVDLDDYDYGDEDDDDVDQDAADGFDDEADN